MLSPLETQTQLDQAGVICAPNFARGALVNAIFKKHKIRMVEQVEGFDTELRLLSPSKREISQEGEVLINRVWPDQAVTPDNARPTCFWIDENPRVKGTIRIVHILGHHCHSGFHVHPVRKAASGTPSLRFDLSPISLHEL